MFPAGRFDCEPVKKIDSQQPLPPAGKPHTAGTERPPPLPDAVIEPFLLPVREAGLQLYTAPHQDQNKTFAQRRRRLHFPPAA